MNISNHHHPRSLSVFFLTEMWERYGYYVVQTLLVLYLTLHFHWNDKNAFELVGTFTAMTYISSLVGGWIADHLLGQKRSIILATHILFLSYILLASVSMSNQLQWALAGIAVGTGLLKPNISSLLGNEYPLNSSKRERGFTIFYIGITTGIILGSTLPNIIHEKFSWSMSFLSASFVMIFAFLIFVYGVYFYQISDYNPRPLKLKNALLTLCLILALYFVGIGVFHYPAVANTLFTLIVIFCTAYIVRAVVSTKGKQSKQNFVIGLLCFISILFWAFYFQMFSSFSLLITRVVAPDLFGIAFPAPYYVAVQSFGIIVFGLILAKPQHHRNIAAQVTQIAKKFAISMFLITIAYAIITAVLYLEARTQLISPLYLIPVYLMISIAELLLSPVGLAAITLLASPNKVSTMMGIFFVSLGIGAFISGKLAKIAALPAITLPIKISKMLYAQAFFKILCLLFAASIICFIIYWFIKYLLKNESNHPLLPEKI